MGAASGLSFAATGFGAARSLGAGFTAAGNERQQAQSTAQMDEFRATQLMDGAEFRRAQAGQTDSFRRQKAMGILGHMQAVAASANTDPSSPTNAALMAREQGQADQERSIRVGDLYDQAAVSESKAGMYMTAAQQTLNRAYANSSSSIIGGLLGGAQSLLSGLSGIKFTG